MQVEVQVLPLNLMQKNSIYILVVIFYGNLFIVRKLFNGCMNIDARLFLRIYGLSGKRILDYFFYYVTKIGDGWIYAVIIGLYLIISTDEAVTVLPPLVAAYALDTVIYIIVKKKVKRTRPYKKIEGITELVIPPDEFSFPSGHTAAAAVMAVIGSSFFPEVRIFLMIYVGLIGFFQDIQRRSLPLRRDSGCCARRRKRQTRSFHLRAVLIALQLNFRSSVHKLPEGL